jgi:transposase
MFVRKKKNKSGVVSIQIISKHTGKYKLLQTIGSSAEELVIEKLYQQARQWIKIKTGSVELDFTDYKKHTQDAISGIESLHQIGVDLLLGKLFDSIGFHQIKEPLFKQLVLARLCYPVSKLKTTDYLENYKGISIDVNEVYRYLDVLYNTQKELVQQISYQHTCQVLGNTVQLVFYDVTTIYFEIDAEDEWRKTGFSKEGKHQHPQILLGLLVSAGGYPLAYDIFEGIKFEGHTLLPVLDKFKQKYRLEKMVVIADAGLLSNDNIQLLQNKGYEYVLGARIKAMSQNIKQQIVNYAYTNGGTRSIVIDTTSKLIISFSNSRAKKDAANRERGVMKLQKQLKSGKLNKSHINNRGYNKFLDIEDEVKLSLNATKIKNDEQWDGLKGYITNTTLTNDEVIENYKQLWQIEKAFRIAKTDLKIRPIYHRVQRRIEAHICIAFAAYKIYKELERQLKEIKSTDSPEKVIDILKTIYKVEFNTPYSSKIYQELIVNSQEQKEIIRQFNLHL